MIGVTDCETDNSPHYTKRYRHSCNKAVQPDWLMIVIGKTHDCGQNTLCCMERSAERKKLNNLITY